jgi:hypothetical protein
MNIKFEQAKPTCYFEWWSGEETPNEIREMHSCYLTEGHEGSHACGSCVEPELYQHAQVDIHGNIIS